MAAPPPPPRPPPPPLRMGYRFSPTEGEILTYIRMKTMNEPVLVPELADRDIYSHNPADLIANAFGPLAVDGYFFDRVREQRRLKRRTPNGIWKSNKYQLITLRDIVVGGANVDVGEKRTFYYYADSNPNKTNWIMVEYHLINPPDAPEIRAASHVICYIYLNGARKIASGGPVLEHFAPVPAAADDPVADDVPAAANDPVADERTP